MSEYGNGGRVPVFLGSQCAERRRIASNDAEVRKPGSQGLLQNRQNFRPSAVQEDSDAIDFRAPADLKHQSRSVNSLLIAFTQRT